MTDFADLDEVPVASTHTIGRMVKHPCTVCNGTGKYLGARVHQEKSHCFACKGQGSFKTSALARAKAKASRQNAAAERLRKIQEINAATGILEAFAELKMAEWNDFANALLTQHNQGRVWSARQIEVANGMISKTRESRARRAKEITAASGPVDLSPVMAMFEQASKRLKRPSYRALGVVISKAPDHGRNAGALYVKSRDGDYLGKVQNNTFIALRTTEASVKDALAKIAANPAEVAKLHGQKTGECCCCGRELTNPSSIAAGIGPVCAENWGF